MTMKEQIIYWREEAKSLHKNIATLKQAIEDLKGLGDSETTAHWRVCKILDIRRDALLVILDQPNNPSPRGPYAPIRKKLQEFASAYEETGGFK